MLLTLLLPLGTLVVIPFFLYLVGATIVGGLAGAALGALIAALLTCLSQPNKETKKIVVLGMKGAGKTTLWNSLRGIQGEAKATQIERIREFELTKNNGEVVKICESYDIGGGDEYVAEYYKTLIERDTFVYFVVRLDQINDKEVLRKIKARLDRITKSKKENNIPDNNFGLKFVATHLDMVGLSKEQVLNELDQKLKIKPSHVLVGSLVGSGTLAEEVKNDIVEGIRIDN